ncbi:hypothetical protein FV139_14545 [Parahaliea maris]|uniref:Lipoprotein n=1 Tax=Parahaliea maris TaxID=2716870 RepID=A0A5C8ZWG8_9GAMM|nr:DUF6491 family protein [Parahaliea maris]TXS91942.1 hypothetical protein FV139_14545 [Parahaliea maris]
MLPVVCRRAIPLVVALALSGCASTGQEAGDDAAEQDPLAALLDDAEDCVPLQRIDRTEVIDEQTVLFFMRGSEVYANRLPNRCPGLRRNKTIMYKTSLSQLCNLDVITVLDQMGGGLQRGASCGLGDFVPISEATVELLREN